MTILYANLKEVRSEYNSFAVIKIDTKDMGLTDTNLKAAIKEHFESCDSCSEGGNPFLVLQKALTENDIQQLLEGGTITLVVKTYDFNDGEIDIELERTWLYTGE